MFYDNGSYMQDLNYYNQNPVMNQNLGYNPYMMNNFQNQNNLMAIQNQQNLKALYPAVYRVICPVASQIVANSNIQYITEENLNNMVDTVYNIVEGDINLSDNSNSNQTSQELNQTVNNRSQNSNSGTNTANNTNVKSNRQNNLLRDLIKIIILNEIMSKRQNQAMMMQNNMQNFNMNQQMF